MNLGLRVLTFSPAPALSAVERDILALVRQLPNPSAALDDLRRQLAVQKRDARVSMCSETLCRDGRWVRTARDYRISAGGGDLDAGEFSTAADIIRTAEEMFCAALGAERLRPEEAEPAWQRDRFARLRAVGTKYSVAIYGLPGRISTEEWLAAGADMPKPSA